MPKLNQIIAIVNGKKTRTAGALTEVYHKLQKPALFEGLSRRYEPLEESGETFPDERKGVQYNAAQAIVEARVTLVDLWDAVATQDFTNCVAKADVVVDGVKVLEQVPVTHLLFLEKQLVDVGTFVSKLPTLDPGEKWSYDAAVDCYASEESRASKTKKTPRNHVKAEATDHHPAQVELWWEDVKVGEWKAIKFSGAISAKERNEMVARVQQLSEAVKIAREEANNVEAKPVKVADKMLAFVFGKK
jgi:hypothetical protein